MSKLPDKTSVTNLLLCRTVINSLSMMLVLITMDSTLLFHHILIQCSLIASLTWLFYDDYIICKKEVERSTARHAFMVLLGFDSDSICFDCARSSDDED